MATLAENAAAVKQAQVAIDAAIVAKGGTTDGGLSNAAAAIASIPAADDSLGFPDIRKILSDNMDGYDYAAIYLIAKRLKTTSLSGAVRYKTSDGSVYSTNASHEWDDDRYIVLKDGTEVKWVIFYFSDSNPTLPFIEANSVLWIFAPDNVRFKYSSLAYSFRGAYFLDFTIDPIQSGDFRNYFLGNYCLIRIPKFDLSEATNISGLLRGCENVLEIPDLIAPLSNGFNSNYSVSSICSNGMFTRMSNVVDLRSESYIGPCLSYRNDGNNNRVQNLPTRFVANVSVDFADITSVSRDCFAVFDSSGNIDLTKAFIGGLSVCENNDQTFTFASALKNQFTAEEQTKIGEAFSAKNWTLVW